MFLSSDWQEVSSSEILSIDDRWSRQAKLCSSAIDYLTHLSGWRFSLVLANRKSFPITNDVLSRFEIQSVNDLSVYEKLERLDIFLSNGAARDPSESGLDGKSGIWLSNEVLIYELKTVVNTPIFSQSHLSPTSKDGFLGTLSHPSEGDGPDCAEKSIPAYERLVDHIERWMVECKENARLRNTKQSHQRLYPGGTPL